ncbi:MAG: hypothetical protein PHE17_05350 [Thiothrix sp.]|uniref:hypothetical protein n=1 Tax=Thiothrix sp. TaxID=1032 RepID=UPI00261DD094|nr:hypothetical protein [Thiothrix sp.]MDD5392428.1 hypothetical protein [Thiothrix sp.]
MSYDRHLMKMLSQKQQQIWLQHNEGTSAYRIALSVGLRPAEAFQQIQQIKKLIGVK